MRKIISLLLVLMLALGLAACGGTSEPSDSTAPSGSTAHEGDEGGTTPEVEMMDLKISGHPAPHSLPNEVAMEKGFFEENGLNVSNTYYISGLSQQEAAPSGTWECGICGIPPTINGALNYGVEIIGFSIYDDAPQYLFVREDSPIYQAGAGNVEGYPDLYGTADTWRGATILAPRGTTAHVLILATLDALGLTEADVNIVHMEVPAAAQAFAAGEGDVMAQWSTFTYDALEDGYMPVSTAAAVGLSLPSPILATSEAIAEKPEAVQRYLDTVVYSMQWINDEANRDELNDIYYNLCIDEGVAISEGAVDWSMEIHHIPTVEELQAMLEVDPETGMNGFEQQVDTVMSFMIRAGVYEESQRQAVLDAINLDFLEETLANYTAE